MTEPLYRCFLRHGDSESHDTGVDVVAFKPTPIENALFVLLISLLTFATFLTLLVFRSLDDNRLTSWQWVFAGVDITRVLPILLLAVVAAYVLSRLSVLERYPGAFLFGSSFIVAGMLWSEPEVIVDTSRYFVQAKFLELYGIGYFFHEWGRNIVAWTDLPLIPFLYGLIFSVFGEARIAIQIFVALLFSATAVLTYLIGKTLWDETVGVYGGVLLLGMPYLLTQVPLMLVDVPAMFFLTLAVFATVKAVGEGGPWRLSASSVVITLAMLSKYSNWLMLSVVPAVALSHFEAGWKATLRRTAVLTIGVVILMGMVLLWNFDLIVEQVALLQSYQLPGLKRWQESFTSTFLFQIHPFITIAAIYSVYRAVRRKDPKYLVISWMLALVILLEVKRIRYTVVAFPMLALMAAYGLRELNDVRIGKFAVSCAVASTLVVVFVAYLPFLQRASAANIKAAGEYFNSVDSDNVEVYVLGQLRSSIHPAVSVPIFDLFTEKEVIYRYEANRIARPGREVIRKSPLRFTWEYRNPQFYGGNRSTVDTPVAVILSDGGQSLPSDVAQRLRDYRLDKVFSTSDGVFNYRTLVRVYEPM